MSVQSGQYGNATFVADVDTGSCTVLDAVPVTVVGSIGPPVVVAVTFALVCHLTKWTLKRAVKTSKYATNITRAKERTVVGGSTGSGTLETVMCMNVAEMLLLKPGDRIRLRLYVAPLIGHEFSAVITEESHDVEIEGGKEVRRTYSFDQDDNYPRFNIALEAAPAAP